MKVELRQYQELATIRLLRVLGQARQGLIGLGSPQGVQFSAPTGAGKTIMLAAAIEGALVGNEYSATADIVADPELTFLWLSDLPELNRQSLGKIQDATTGLSASQFLEIDQDFDRSELEPGKVYFLNYQKLRAGSLLARISDDRSNTIWETIAATQSARPGKLVAIIDEAHRGLGNQRVSQTIASRFVVGAQRDATGKADPLVRAGPSGVPRPFPALDIIVGISATPERFAAYLSNTGGRSLYPVHVEAAAVLDSGLIKERLVLNGPREGDAPWTLLERAAQKTLEFDRRWRAYADANDLEPVVPALLVQVEDGSVGRDSSTPLAQVLDTLRAVWPDLMPSQVAHCFHGAGRVEAGPDWLVDYCEPNSIARDEHIRVVLFKTALNTGWDCPRAEVLMSFRRLQDRTAIAQLVGRMVRTPLGKRVAGDTALNSTHLFLPFFDRDELALVKAELTADSGDIGTDVQRAEDIQELVVRPDGEALFDRLKIVPTEVVPSSRPIPDVRRLLRFARLLEQDGLDPNAVREQLNGLLAVLTAEFEGRQQYQGFHEVVRDRGRVTVSSLSIENGEVVAEDTQETDLSEEDVQTSFRRAALLISEDVAAAWNKRRFNLDDPLQAKLEFIELTASQSLLMKLQAQARRQFRQLEQRHRAQIVALTPGKADFYATLQRAGRVVQRAIMAPSGRVIFPVTANARQESKHLYVRPETEDVCALSLTGWEAEAIEEERRRPDFRGFLRNLDRKSWSLSYAYEYDGIRPGFPDLIVFRNGVSGGLTVDLLDPHLDAGDSVAKAKGLALFARTYGEEFGRIEMLRRFDGAGPLFRLPFSNSVVAEAVLENMTSAASLNLAFKELGYVADW